MKRILGASLVFLLTFSGGVAGAQTNDPDDYESLSQYFQGDIDKATLEDRLRDPNPVPIPQPGGATGSSGTVPPSPNSGASTATSSNSEEPADIPWLSCQNGGTPVITSGSMPEGPVSITVTGDGEGTLTISFNELDRDPIIVDVSDCGASEE